MNQYQQHRYLEHLNLKCSGMVKKKKKMPINIHSYSKHLIDTEAT